MDPKLYPDQSIAAPLRGIFFVFALAVIIKLIPLVFRKLKEIPWRIFEWSDLILALVVLFFHFSLWVRLMEKNWELAFSGSQTDGEFLGASVIGLIFWIPLIRYRLRLNKLAAEFGWELSCYTESNLLSRKVMGHPVTLGGRRGFWGPPAAKKHLVSLIVFNSQGAEKIVEALKSEFDEIEYGSLATTLTKAGVSFERLEELRGFLGKINSRISDLG